MKNLVDKIVARSDKRNRRKGQLKTIALTALQVVSQSGVLDAYPVVKTIVDVVSGIVLKQVTEHALNNNEGV